MSFAQEIIHASVEEMELHWLSLMDQKERKIWESEMIFKKVYSSDTRTRYKIQSSFKDQISEKQMILMLSKTWWTKMKLKIGNLFKTALFNISQFWKQWKSMLRCPFKMIMRIGQKMITTGKLLNFFWLIRLTTEPSIFSLMIMQTSKLQVLIIYFQGWWLHCWC